MGARSTIKDDQEAAYAAALREPGAIRTSAVERAFATVPRHLFLPCGCYSSGRSQTAPTEPGDELLDHIYSDNALMTHVPKSDDAAGRYSSTSQPRVIASALDMPAARLPRGAEPPACSAPAAARCGPCPVDIRPTGRLRTGAALGTLQHGSVA
ncbi:hypothetical protein [Streptomyces sp. NRRL S-1868]|uniref:hypothetical protein n=1 Tax=Streptomyces sp. NRRL S-1868 TaxID=1463892 RepID=UPI0004CAF58B|nr:hypothetical protein [Streptomyces sp. NRRL S-1868]